MGSAIVYYLFSQEGSLTREVDRQILLHTVAAPVVNESKPSGGQPRLAINLARTQSSFPGRLVGDSEIGRNSTREVPPRQLAISKPQSRTGDRRMSRWLNFDLVASGVFPSSSRTAFGPRDPNPLCEGDLSPAILRLLEWHKQVNPVVPKCDIIELKSAPRARSHNG
jgi:hypothetical protein